MQHVVLHCLWHSSAPDQEVEGFPDTVSAVCLFYMPAQAPICPSAPFPAAPVHAAVSGQQLCESLTQCTFAALVPVLKKKKK